MTGGIGELRRAVCEIFDEAQRNGAAHRKLIQQLHELHRSTVVGEEGERDFFLALIHCLNMALVVRRAEEAVNCTLRFLVGFVMWATGRDEDEGRVMGCPTRTTRLVENLLAYALQGIDSKERQVRGRLCQVVMACVNAVDEMGDELWSLLRSKMTERLFDKEAAVRVQAVHAMARLQSVPLMEVELMAKKTVILKSGIIPSSQQSQLLVIDIFLELLTHDPSTEVRRAVLRHIEVDERTLPTILQRRRDVDATVRRLFYSQKLMKEIDMRMLSIEQRDAIVLSGLRDRDAGVRRSCMELVFGRWVQSTDNNLIGLLVSLDVVQNVEVAEAALQAFYELVPEPFPPTLPEAYLDTLTPETAIALRVYCQKQAGNEQESQRVGELLPSLSELALHIRHRYESLVGEGEEEEENYRAESEFVLAELFSMAALLDGADEMGRRVLQTLLVEMLANLQLADQLFSKALDLLSSTSPDPPAFLQMVSQLISDLHDLYTEEGEHEQEENSSNPSSNANRLSSPSNLLDLELDKSLSSLSISSSNLNIKNENPSTLPEDVRILAQLRCLELVAVALRLPNLSINRHSEILQMLTHLIIPAVNSSYAAVQAKGLLALSLACSLSSDLARQYAALFGDFFRLGQEEETRQIALKAIFDLLFLLPPLSSDPDCDSNISSSDNPENHHDLLLKHATMALYDEDQAVQAIASEGFAKLLLHRIVSNVSVLVGLFQLYLHPATVNNLRLRQTLSAFFQAFAYSSSRNQNLLSHALLPILEVWLPGESASPLSAMQVASQLLELTDPANLVPTAERIPGPHAHAILAEPLAWAALSALGRPQGRLYVQMLSKLRIDQDCPWSIIKRLLFVVGHLIRATGGGGTVGERAMVGGLKKLVALLVELDDPTEMLDPQDLLDLRQKLASLPPREQRTNQHHNEKQTASSKSTLRSTTTKQNTCTTTNIMDEIGELLLGQEEQEGGDGDDEDGWR